MKNSQQTLTHHRRGCGVQRLTGNAGESEQAGDTEGKVNTQQLHLVTC